MHSSALSEIFWDAIESLHTKRSHLLTTFRTDLLQERAVQYAAVIGARGEPLDNCIGFMDGTKVQMCTAAGPALNQRNVVLRT